MTVNNHIKHGTQVAKGASYLFPQGAVANVTNLLFLTIAARLLSISNIGAVSALGIIGSFFITIARAVIVVFSQLLVNKYYMLPLHIVIGALVYVLMLRISKVVNKQDVRLFSEFFPKRFHWLINLFARFFSPAD